jgi:hypothetical protein
MFLGITGTITSALRFPCIALGMISIAAVHICAFTCQLLGNRTLHPGGSNVAIPCTLLMQGPALQPTSAVGVHL